MVVNYLRVQPADPEAGPLDSVALTELKNQLAQRPQDENLTQQIRTLDLQLRQQFFTRRDMNLRGSYLLLGGLIIFLIGLKSSASLRAKVHLPQTSDYDQTGETQRLKIARRWVTIFGLILVGAILALATMSASVLTRSSPGHVESKAGPPAQLLTTYPNPDQIAAHWPRFRGPGGRGISAYTNIPESWDGATGVGILWKTAVPLPGHNSPIVWGKRVFLSGADEKQRQVYCFDADSGILLWQKDVVVSTGGGSVALEVSQDTGYAAPTMTTDGRRVFAIFPNGDLACFDFDGRQVWAKNLGLPDSAYGFATSLDMYQNLLLIQFDQGTDDDNKSKLFALDAATGRSVWQKTRPVANAWTSPIIVNTDQGPQFITCSTPLVISYDPLTGKELWRVNCMGSDVAPSPIYAKGLVFVAQPYEQLYALRPGSSDGRTEPNIIWTADDGIPDICSPVSNGELIFLLTTDGTLTCYETQTGAKVWQRDLDAEFRSSPSVVGDKLYLLSENEDGLTFILSAAREFREIARAKLGEPSSCCPAFADGRIYVRGYRNLYGIGKK